MNIFIHVGSLAHTMTTKSPCTHVHIFIHFFSGTGPADRRFPFSPPPPAPESGFLSPPPPCLLISLFFTAWWTKDSRVNHRWQRGEWQAQLKNGATGCWSITCFQRINLDTIATICTCNFKHILSLSSGTPVTIYNYGPGLTVVWLLDSDSGQIWNDRKTEYHKNWHGWPAPLHVHPLSFKFFSSLHGSSNDHIPHSQPITSHVL